MENSMKRTRLDLIKLPHLNNVEIVVEQLVMKEYSILTDSEIDVEFIHAMILDSDNKIQYLARGKDINDALNNIGKEITSTILSKRTNFAY